MAKSFVFLVHGVGIQKVREWHLPWTKSIVDALGKYRSKVTAGDLEFIPIHYDQVFENFRDTWQRKLAGTLAQNEVLAQGGLSDAPAWVAEEANTYKDLFWDHALDAVLWYSLPLARAAVQASVSEQLVKGLRKATEAGSTDVHIIAHSLGTSVITDALIGLRAANSIHRGALAPEQVRFRSITMIANTSRLLRAWKDIDEEADLAAYDAEHSVLRPGAGGVTDQYLNFRHQIDPITWPLRFAPRDWPRDSYLGVMTSHFKNPKQVHEVAHYLANPQVHVHVLRALTGQSALVTAEENRKAWTDFKKAYPLTTSEIFSELKSLFGDDSDRRLTPQQLARFFAEALRVLR
jgi:hypothetical protein